MSTIFAPITAAFASGISVIRISGSLTTSCLKALGVCKELKHREVAFCKIYDGKQILDECLISFFKAPQSFTGEDVAEISIHASPFILKKILEILGREKNCRLAEAGEFSKRAFLNNKIDLIQAEAIPDLIAAETAMQHRQAIKQLEGKLGEIYEKWRYDLIEISSLIEAAIDFPDEDLPQNIIDDVENRVEKLAHQIKNHLNDNQVGEKIKQGLSLAIIGAPNVGKSSLINFLAKSDIAIVSEIAGTTRDVIETSLNIAGAQVRICDTAGIHETTDKIEAEGIRRALKKADAADIKIYMIDASNPQIDQNLIDEKTIIVVNKTDLKNFSYVPLTYEMGIAAKRDASRRVSVSEGINDKNFEDKNSIAISLKEIKGLQLLINKIEEKIIELIPSQNSPAITQERYRILLKNCVENLENFSLNKNIELAAEDLRISARELGKIIGRVDVDDILDVIFSRFCIGK